MIDYIKMPVHASPEVREQINEANHLIDDFTEAYNNAIAKIDDELRENPIYPTPTHKEAIRRIGAMFKNPEKMYDFSIQEEHANVVDFDTQARRLMLMIDGGMRSTNQSTECFVDKSIEEINDLCEEEGLVIERAWNFNGGRSLILRAKN